MSNSSEISREDWLGFFFRFSNGNRGRRLSLEVFYSESTHTEAIKEGILKAVDYDPLDEDNNIVISTGCDEFDFSHSIATPVEVRQSRHENGQVESLEIIDRNNVKTKLRFDSS